MSEQQVQQESTLVTFAGLVLKFVFGLVFLPALVPVVVARAIGPTVATKWRFWVVPRWWWVANTVGAVVFVAVLAWEIVGIVAWVRGGGIDRLTARTDGFGERSAEMWLMVWPWLIVNLVLGACLVPLVLSVRRRTLRRLTRTRRIPDVVRQEQIERAQTRAADYAAARRIGVTVDETSGGVTAGKKLRTAPMKTSTGGQAFGVRAVDTVRNTSERFHDERVLKDWCSNDRRLVVVPDSAAAMRALLLAESGSGKTVLLNGVIASALGDGWRVVFIDGKGAPEDAEYTAGIARTLGYTASVSRPWNLFRGTADQITGTLLRTWPVTGGDGGFYRDEAESTLRAIQAKSPVRSFVDVRDRLRAPAPHVADQADVEELMTEVSRGITRAQRVWSGLSNKVAGLVPIVDVTGWSFADTSDDLTVVPLSPADPNEKRLGDLMLHSLRIYLADRLKERDKSRVLVVVDEFAQLVGADVDAGDTATSLFETCRSAGLGLWLVAQSASGLSNDQTTRKRLLASGAAIIVGRSKDPEEVISLAGTKMQMEASGGAQGDELRSGRSQHTFVLPPGVIRDASVGAFWMIQAGTVLPFRALPVVSPQPEHLGVAAGAGSVSAVAAENDVVAEEAGGALEDVSS